jgi:hypothetical protein
VALVGVATCRIAKGLSPADEPLDGRIVGGAVRRRTTDGTTDAA